jgi:hypothetical protein
VWPRCVLGALRYGGIWRSWRLRVRRPHPRSSRVRLLGSLVVPLSGGGHVEVGLRQSLVSPHVGRRTRVLIIVVHRCCGLAGFLRRGAGAVCGSCGGREQKRGVDYNSPHKTDSFALVLTCQISNEKIMIIGRIDHREGRQLERESVKRVQRYRASP